MDLRIEIRDEYGDVLLRTSIYQDGSDSEAAEQIKQYLRENFKVEANPDADEFECTECERVFDNDDSLEHDGDLYCPPCYEKITGETLDTH